MKKMSRTIARIASGAAFLAATMAITTPTAATPPDIRCNLPSLEGYCHAQGYDIGTRANELCVLELQDWIATNC